jgi:ADP-heptose:LPS heptosyltransferase
MAMISGNRILIIKLGALGDVVLATPQLRAIVEAYPEAEVTLLTSPDCAALVQGLPGLEVVAFRRRGFIEMIRVLAWLRRRRFSVVFDLQGSLRSQSMTLCSGARQRIGRQSGIAYTQAPTDSGGSVHAFDVLNRVLAAAGLEPAPPRAWLPESVAAAAKVDDWLRRHGLASGGCVLLHAGSSARWPSKRWERVHFERLASALAGRGFSVIWIGADEDRDLNRRLADQVGVDATGAFTLLELAALGRRAAFAVVNDSAPMHILSACGLPVYALFGPTDWRRSHGLGQADRVLVNPVPCSPCHRPVCPPEYGHRCLNNLTPTQVLTHLAADGWLVPT